MKFVFKIILISLYIVYPIDSFCQLTMFTQSFRLNEDHYINKRDVYTLQSMGIIYLPAKEFYGTSNRFEYKSAPSFGRIGSIIGSSIEAKDYSVAILFYIDYIFDKKDSISTLFIDKFKMNLSQLHLNLLKSTPDIKNINYYSDKDAITKFNADTALVFDVDMHGEILSEKHLFGQYIKCKALLLQKNERGYITMFCFFNEDKDWNKYQKTIEKLFIYK